MGIALVPTCPTHNKELVIEEAPVAGGILYVCPDIQCQYSTLPSTAVQVVPSPGKITTLKIPGLDPGRPQKTANVKEETVERWIAAELRARGYIVLRTTVRYQFSPCMHCERMTRPNGGYGASKGIADLLVTHMSWPPNTWRQLEVKGPDTPLSSAQARLLAAGRIAVVWTVEDALAAVQVGAPVPQDEGRE